MNSDRQTAAVGLLAQLTATISDARLSDEEKQTLTQALRETRLPSETLSHLRNRAFDLVRERLDSLQPAPPPDAPGLLRWLEGVVRAIDVARAPSVAVRSSAYFSPGPRCQAAIVSQLRAARLSVDICVFTLSDDRITAEVLASLRRGVALRLITDNEKVFDRGSDIGALREGGVPIVVDQTAAHMHHKFAIFDGERLLNGSYNWTRSAAQHNEENLVLTNDPDLIDQFSAEFDRLWVDLGGPPQSAPRRK